MKYKWRRKKYSLSIPTRGEDMRRESENLTNPIPIEIHHRDIHAAATIAREGEELAPEHPTRIRDPCAIRFRSVRHPFKDTHVRPPPNPRTGDDRIMSVPFHIPRRDIHAAAEPRIVRE